MVPYVTVREWFRLELFQVACGSTWKRKGIPRGSFIP